MNRDDVQTWLNRYIEAWRTYDAEKIGDLFSKDALYFYRPADEDNPVRGRMSIVASWLEQPDNPNSWNAHYDPIAVDGGVAVAQGRTRYMHEDGAIKREFDNIFVIHFDDEGRCSRFTEWYMQRPDPGA